MAADCFPACDGVREGLVVACPEQGALRGCRREFRECGFAGSVERFGTAGEPNPGRGAP